MSQRITHVVPIGFEEDRAVYGFINLSANRIYLLIDEKEGVWGEEARRHADAVKKRLNQMAFEEKNIICVYFDPTDFESSKNAVIEILEKEKDTSNYDNALLYYVVPEQYNLPPKGAPFSSGARRVEVFSPKVSIKFGEWEREILQTLALHKVSSLGDLNRILAPDDISKAMRAKLSYYVRKLQKEGYIIFHPGKSIDLTDLGMSKVRPPKDDAELVVG
jgi:hypothetical protein